MATRCLYTTIILALVMMARSAAYGGGGQQVILPGWVPIGVGGGGGKSECGGTVAECLGGEEDEFDLSSEVSRRILAGTRYISYGALRRDSVPCSRRGASYYNCRPGAQANPYSRGCSAITRCRS